MKGVTILKSEDFYNRLENFKINTTAAPEIVLYCEKKLKLFATMEQLANRIKENKITDGSEILEMVFQTIFQTVFQTIETDEEKILGISCQKIFQEEFIKYMYDACSFTSLTHFINKTKRNESGSLTDFVYKYSPLEYNKEGSPNYCPRDQVSDILINETETMRQARNRILSKRPAHYKRNEWHAMPEDSETEWALYYLFAQRSSAEVDAETLMNLCDTYKRIKNLYNGVIQEPATEKNRDQIVKSYRKFESKLKKIKYENYLKMIKVILDHIYPDKENYGINIYRLERCLRPYTLSKEIKAVLSTEDLNQKMYILEKIRLLSEIWFPQIYQYLFDFRNLNKIIYHFIKFYTLLESMVIPVNLVLDEFIDQDFFSKEWENLFKQTLNEMAKDVFYLPDQIDYSIEPKSQEAFEELLKYPVICALHLDDVEDVL